MITAGEPTRDPRARRAALEARRRGLDVVALGLAAQQPLELDGVEIVRLGGDRMSGALRRAGLGGMRRQRPLVREARGVYRLARMVGTTARLARAARSQGAFDVVHANDFDTLPAAWLAARRSEARLVYDAHEIYTDQEPDPPRLYRAVVATLEGLLARRADAVSTVSEPIADELGRQLRLRRPVAVVLNCPERDDSVPEPTPRNGPLRVIYQGAMGPGRPLDDLLVAASHAQGAELTLRVVGVDEHALRQETERLGVAERVHVAEPVSPTKLVQALQGFDVGVIINRPVTRNDELVFPNKLFEYLMAGLAVVVPRLPGLTPLVEGEQLGLTYEPGRPELLGAALAELAADPERVTAMRRRARALALDRLNAEAQRGALAAVWGI
jgi:glycogen(starch) synthase